MLPITPVTDPAVTALLEAERRSARGGAPRSVVLLHLSGPALAQPRQAQYHGRVARAVLNDVAQRLDGEVLRLANGDLALVCRRRAGRPDAIGPDGDGPEGLRAVLRRLFSISGVKEADLFSCWHLPADGELLRRHLIDPARTFGIQVSIADGPDPLRSVGALLDLTGMIGLIRRQTAVQIELIGASRRMRPSFQEVTVSIAALETRAAAYGRAQADPFLFRHMAARLDQPMMLALAEQIRLDSSHLPLDRNHPSIPLHINLALPGVLSKAFTSLAEACSGRHRPLRVEVSMIEACDNPSQFEAAKCKLHTTGTRLIIDGVTADLLQMTRPGELGASMIKLDWSPELPRVAGLKRGALIEALKAIAPGSLILHRAETEASIVWGLEHDITVFQGRYVDAIMAANRLKSCPYATGCTLRQCMDRAAAMSPAGTLGCQNIPLLNCSRSDLHPA